NSQIDTDRKSGQGRNASEGPKKSQRFLDELHDEKQSQDVQRASGILAHAVGPAPGVQGMPRHSYFCDTETTFIGKGRQESMQVPVDRDRLRDLAAHPAESTGNIVKADS